MGGGAIRRPTGGAAGAGRAEAGLGSGAMEPPAPASPPAPSSPWRLVLAVVLTGAATRRQAGAAATRSGREPWPTP